jgi:hypothetical protein
MAALYQLSYVGANPNPSVVVADLDTIRHEMTISAPSFLGAFSWRVSGAILSLSQSLPVTIGAKSPVRTGPEPAKETPLLSMVGGGPWFKPGRRLGQTPLSDCWAFLVGNAA